MSESSLYIELIQQLRADFNASHLRESEGRESLRKEMHAGFTALSAQLADHAKDDDKVADRVLIIETERREEAKQALKRGAWAGVLAGAGISGAIEVVKHWFKP